MELLMCVMDRLSNDDVDDDIVEMMEEVAVNDVQARGRIASRLIEKRRMGWMIAMEKAVL
jgi:hypothetical protein